MLRRRVILKSAAVAAAAAPVPASAGFFSSGSSNEKKPFDYAWLKGEARTLASKEYQPPENNVPASLASLDWDSYQAIRFRNDHSLWVDDDLLFQIRFFHLGRGFKEPVRMYEVVDGMARHIDYDPEMFDFKGSGVNGSRLSPDLDFAGFRIQFHTDWISDVAAFLGASYFRAVGAEKQYGLSARGLAVDTGLNRPEEFPFFKAFWLEKPSSGQGHLVVYALMDSPSLAGAYRFDIAPGDTLTMDVDAAIYPRKPIERLGIAPLTSMYQMGENDRRLANDWRPEIHDSDGLQIWAGNGEQIWRPLVNPPGVRVNSFMDGNPRGFGLMQRDRQFDHYQDDGVFYEKRPSLWVEPKTGATTQWGKGAVQLVEIPTLDETFDNIVAYWNPADAPQPGQELLFSYRLYWGTGLPAIPLLARVTDTRTGIGGVIGRPRTYFSWRFAVDFSGGALPMIRGDINLEPVISASRGEIEITSVRPIAGGKNYRAMFDLKPTDESPEPIDLRLYLRANGQALSETWIYQWTPPTVEERRKWLVNP
jgi:glucans biosynthesis protein